MFKSRLNVVLFCCLILVIGVAAAVKISDLTALLNSSITDNDAIVFELEDVTGAAPYKITLQELGKATSITEFTATSHGLTSADVGKPLHGVAVWDDTDINTYPTSVLMRIPDSNTLAVAGAGAIVDLPVTKLKDGASYNVAEGYGLYWDASAGKYIPTIPTSTSFDANHVLMLLKVESTTFRAIVLCEHGDHEEYEIVVNGTGFKAVDTVSMQAAETYLEGKGGGTVFIRGKVSLNAIINYSAPISLVGVQGTNAEIEYNDNLAEIGWNRNYDPFTATNVRISQTEAFDPYIRVPVGTLAQGDWFYAHAENTLTDGMTHNSGWDNRPGELHQVKEIRTASTSATFTVDTGADEIDDVAHGLSNGDVVTFTTTTTLPGGLNASTVYYVINKTADTYQVATTPTGGATDITSAGSGTHTWHGPDYIVFDEFIVDPLTTNPKVTKVTMFKDVLVEGIRFSWTGSTAPSLPCCFFNTCSGLTVRNCYFECPTANELLFNYCGNTTVTDCHFENAYDFDGDDGYHLVVGAVNGFLFTDSVAYGARHVFTTSADTSGGDRTGTPRNVKIHNVIAHVSGSNGSTLVAFDTHAEGWGVVFDSCLVDIPDDLASYPGGAGNANRAFQTRSRHTIYKNCVVQGTRSSFPNAFYVIGADTVLDGCYVEGCWRGIYIYEEPNTDYVDGTIITNCTLKDCDGGAVIIVDGDNCHIKYNNIVECGRISPYGAIHITDGTTTGHKIEFNSVIRDGTNNHYFISGTSFDEDMIDIVGNNLRGYVTGETGTFDASNDYFTTTDLNHPWVNGEVVRFTTTGALPAELSTGTNYFIVDRASYRFKVSTTSGGAAIDLTDTGSGTHTAHISTDSGFEWDNTNFTNLQSEADSFNWTD